MSFPGKWLGQSGDVNDLHAYVEIQGGYLNVAGGLSEYIRYFGVYVNDDPSQIGPPGTSDTVIFGYHLAGGPLPPTKPADPEDGIAGFSFPDGVYGIATTTTGGLPGGPPRSPEPLYVPASYTVTGTTTLDAVDVGSGPGQTVTLAGVLTLTGASQGVAPAFLVQGGAANVSGGITVRTYGEVDDNALIVGGTAGFTGTNSASFGQISLLLVGGQLDVLAGGSVTTAGVRMNTGAGGGATAATARIKVSGKLTDTDASVGLQIGSAGGGKGILTVDAGGVVNSVTATIGAADGTQARATIASGGTWTNTGSVTLYAKSSLSVAGEFDVGGLDLKGKASFTAAVVAITETSVGGIDVDQGATLTITNGSNVTTPSLSTQSGGTATIESSQLSDGGGSGLLGSPGSSGYAFNGDVDIKSSTLAAGNSYFKVGYVDPTAGPYDAIVTVTGGVETVSDTIIGDATRGSAATGTLTLSHVKWKDQGTGTTMTVGNGGVGVLHLTSGGQLTDQDVAIGTVAPSTPGATAGAVTVDGGSTWTVMGSLAIGGQGNGALSISAHGMVNVAGDITISSSATGSSSVTVTGATLALQGDNITVGGQGQGGLAIHGGTVSDAGTVEIENGALTVDNSYGGAAGMLDADALMVDGGAHAIILNGTVDGLAATISQGGQVEMLAGLLAVNTLVVSTGGTISGSGTIGDPSSASPTAAITASGGTIIQDGDELDLNGNVSGGKLIINGGFLGVNGALNADQVDFDGPNGILSLPNDAPGAISISSIIYGFAATDQIAVASNANKAAWSGGELFLYNDVNLVGSIALSGNYQNTQFAAVPNASGISRITITSGGPNGQPPLDLGPPPPPPLDDLPGAAGARSLSVSPIGDPDGTTLNVTVSDQSGLLGATASGSAAVQNDGTLLALSGSFADVNAALATLTYTGTSPGPDVVTISATDDQGAAGTESVDVTVTDPPITIDVPGAQSVVAGTSAAIAGAALGDPLAAPFTLFTVTVTDATGALSATAAGAATLTGSGGQTLTLTGDLSSIDRALATLTYDGATGASVAPSDTIAITATDPFGGTATETIAVTITQPVAPTETDWATGEDGDAGDAANWTGGIPNSSLETVATPGDYTVSGNITAGQFIVEGDPTFTGSVTAAGVSGDYQTFVVEQGGAADFDGGTLTTASAVIGDVTQDTGALSLTNGASASLSGTGDNSVGASFYLGLAVNGTGALSISASSVSAAEGFIVGVAGAGALSISSAGTLMTADTTNGGYAGADVGYAATGSGAIDVDGAGSTLFTAAFLDVGVLGSGALDITNGGHVTSSGTAGVASGALGYSAGGSGFASVDGMGSEWDVTQSLAVGYDGTGFMSVTDGGTVEVDGPYLRVARDPGSLGLVEVYGAGSTIEAPNAALYVGRDGQGAIQISDGAAATFGDVVVAQGTDAPDASIEVDAGGVLNILGTLGDGASPSTTISVSGGTIATGGGFDVGNGTSDKVNLTGGTITGGIGLGAGASLQFDQTSDLGGNIALSGGTLDYAGGLPNYVLANAITVSGDATGGAGALSDLGADGLDLTGTMTFAPGVAAILELDGSVKLGGTILGFGPRDVLDLRNFANGYSPDNVTWANGTLTLAAGQQVVETLNISGDYAADTFFLVPVSSSQGVALSVAVPTTDPGPTAADGATTVGHSRTTDLTSAIGALVTPGVAGDTSTVIAASSSLDAVVFGSGKVLYSAGSSPSDTVSYTVENEYGQIATGTLDVRIDPGPTAANGAVGATAGETLDLTALINGLVTPGIAGDTETLTNVSAATGGATLGTDNAVTYVAPASGSDTISYTVADEYGDTQSAEVAVTVACYARGTRISTADGEVAIEDLAIGDFVATESGARRKIRWIGRRSYGGRFAARNPDILPVVIKAGALYENTPRRDLTVSPLHAMYLDGLLVPAIRLVNGASIIQRERIDLVEYFHVELDTHDVILAEGAPSESFVDDDSRLMFHNAHEYDALYPGAKRVPAFYCAPRVIEGFTLAAIRERLAARAGPRAAATAVPLRGYLDRVGTSLIEGWAQNPERPEVPVCLDVLVDGAVVARTLANRFRADLASAGLGSGRHGFSARLKQALTPDARAKLVVRRSSDQTVLARSAASARLRAA